MINSLYLVINGMDYIVTTSNKHKQSDHNISPETHHLLLSHFLSSSSGYLQCLTASTSKLLVHVLSPPYPGVCHSTVWHYDQICWGKGSEVEWVTQRLYSHTWTHAKNVLVEICERKRVTIQPSLVGSNLYPRKYEFWWWERTFRETLELCAKVRFFGRFCSSAVS